MHTTVHAYCFDVRDPSGAAAYKALREELTALGLRCFETHGGSSHYRPALNGRTVGLETKHLFDNQWNTAPIEGVSGKGLRLFDWAQDFNSQIGAPTGIKRGHWLEQTPEMVSVRRDTAACGYCGKQEPVAKGYDFCPHCLDSAYLKESELHLTRMVPVAKASLPRAPLTEAERAHRLPLYREAQLHGSSEGGRERIAKVRADILTRAEKTIAHATAERDGMLWLLDNALSTENAIFYSHTGRFGFGWRTPLSADQAKALRDHLEGFPAPYDIVEG